MKTELKYTFEDEEQNNVLPFTNALERESFLFDLFNNFFMQWKYQDTDPTLDEIRIALFDLKNKYNVIIED